MNGLLFHFFIGPFELKLNFLIFAFAFVLHIKGRARR